MRKLSSSVDEASWSETKVPRRRAVVMIPFWTRSAIA